MRAQKEFLRYRSFENSHPVIEIIESIIATMTGGAIAHAIITAPAITHEETEQDRWLVYEITYNEYLKDSKIQVGFNRVYKYGISGQNFNSDGTHPRPSTQVSNLNTLEAAIANDDTYPTVRVYKSEVIIQNVSKLAAEFMEQDAVNVYYSTHGEAPEGNKKPLPDPLRGRVRKKFEKIDQKLNPNQVSKIKEFLKRIKN